jgi:hypothetical protein
LTSEEKLDQIRLNPDKLDIFFESDRILPPNTRWNLVLLSNLGRIVNLGLDLLKRSSFLSGLLLLFVSQSLPLEIRDEATKAWWVSCVKTQNGDDQFLGERERRSTTAPTSTGKNLEKKSRSFLLFLIICHLTAAPPLLILHLLRLIPGGASTSATPLLGFSRSHFEPLF